MNFRDLREKKDAEKKGISIPDEDMGTVIKDFQKSDAPQFKGKSDKKKREMAIAAKLQSESTKEGLDEGKGRPRDLKHTGGLSDAINKSEKKALKAKERQQGKEETKVTETTASSAELVSMAAAKLQSESTKEYGKSMSAIARKKQQAAMKPGEMNKLNVLRDMMKNSNKNESVNKNTSFSTQNKNRKPSLNQNKLSSAEYQKAKKLKGFNKDDWKWNGDLYIKQLMKEDVDLDESTDKLTPFSVQNKNRKPSLGQSKLSSAEYQKAKKQKAFNKDDWKWNGDLYVRVNESVELDEKTKLGSKVSVHSGEHKGKVGVVRQINKGRFGDPSQVRHDLDFDDGTQGVVDPKHTKVMKEDVDLDESYEDFFNTAMKKFGVDSPADFKSEKERKKFFDYVDKNYEAENELDEKMDDKTKERIRQEVKDGARSFVKPMRRTKNAIMMDRLRKGNAELRRQLNRESVDPVTEKYQPKTVTQKSTAMDMYKGTWTPPAEEQGGTIFRKYNRKVQMKKDAKVLDKKAYQIKHGNDDDAIKAWNSIPANKNNCDESFDLGEAVDMGKVKKLLAPTKNSNEGIKVLVKSLGVSEKEAEKLIQQSFSESVKVGKTFKQVREIK